MNKIPSEPNYPTVTFDRQYLDRLNFKLYEVYRALANGINSLLNFREAYSITSATTLQIDDDVVLVDTSGGSVTVTLPAVTDAMIYNRQEHEVVKTSASNTMTIVPSGSDTVVGTTSVAATIQWTALRFRAISGGWVLI